MGLLVINLEQSIRELNTSCTSVCFGFGIVGVVEGVEVLAISVDKVAFVGWVEPVVVEDLRKKLRANAPGCRMPYRPANSSCDH